MKRACVLLCAFLLLLAALPAGASQVKTSGDYRYSLDEEGKAVITAHLVGEAEIAVPGQVDGYPLTAIGEEVFSGRDSLISISLPEGLTRIDDRAFSFCVYLENLTLPDSLSLIGFQAFAFCMSLRELALPDGLTAIGYEAFTDCEALESLILPEGLLSIGSLAFSLCPALSSQTLPASLTQVGMNPWADTPAALTLAPGNPVLALRDSVLFHEGEHKLITFPYGDGRSTYFVPEGTLVIGGWAFRSCEALTDITLPEGLHTIEEASFAGCIGLTGLTLPSGLRSIGNDAFVGCEGLQTLSLNAGIEYIGEEVFADCPSLTLSVVRGSYAETWAMENSVPFIYTGEQ